MDNRIWQTVRAVLMDKRLVSVGFLLLAVVTIYSLLPCDLHPIVSELDILEHFLFGFVLSDFASAAASPIRLTGWLNEKLRWKDSRRVDMMIRISGFLLIGGVLWELSELFIFPLFGSRPNQFFSFPITLTNTDGAIDVTVGILGCILAGNL